MSEANNHGADIPKEDIDHVELWKYFESRGSNVKDTMFKVITWVVGFAAVILGFMLKETITLETDSLGVSKPSTLLVLSCVGFVVILYANILIRDFADHINRNFDRADRARDKTKSLLDILDIDQESQNTSVGLPDICKYVLGVIWVFGVVFLLGVFAAILTI